MMSRRVAAGVRVDRVLQPPVDQLVDDAAQLREQGHVAGDRPEQRDVLGVDVLLHPRRVEVEEAGVAGFGSRLELAEQQLDPDRRQHRVALPEVRRVAGGADLRGRVGRQDRVEEPFDAQGRSVRDRARPARSGPASRRSTCPPRGRPSARARRPARRAGSPPPRSGRRRTSARPPARDPGAGRCSRPGCPGRRRAPAHRTGRRAEGTARTPRDRPPRPRAGSRSRDAGRPPPRPAPTTSGPATCCRSRSPPNAGSRRGGGPPLGTRRACRRTSRPGRPGVARVRCAGPWVRRSSPGRAGSPTPGSRA